MADNDTVDDGASSMPTERRKGLLDRIFNSCRGDPRGSVHRAWGISLIFVVVYFVLSVIEMINIQSQKGSIALVIAAVYTGVIHLVLGVLGTFVLKRFPTSFSVGFLLGVLVVLANQNLILFGTFARYEHGSPRTNHIFAALGFTLFCVLSFMALILMHFKSDVVVAPMDIKAENARSSGYQEYDDPEPVGSEILDESTI